MRVFKQGKLIKASNNSYRELRRLVDFGHEKSISDPMFC